MERHVKAMPTSAEDCLRNQMSNANKPQTNKKLKTLYTTLAGYISKDIPMQRKSKGRPQWKMPAHYSQPDIQP